MSDDTASRKPRRTTRRPRVLVVSNASPETSSDEGVASQVPPKPRPLPSPSHSLATAEAYGPYRNGSTPASFPTPLNTTGIPSHRSNQSNPALSSPSSTSSPAVESTPPPSTPGLGGYSIPSNEEGTFRQGMLGPIVGQDRTDHTPQVSRPQRQQFVGQSHERRYSSGGSRPATSPTVSTTSDSYIPSRYRPSPNQKVIVLVTTDAENLHIVDITGAMTPAFIRERIFTKLQIPDEDQSKYSIYRTEINRFAMGNALTDEELFDLYKERGDDNGSLKLLVSHSHASVHEPTYEDIPTSMVNTIPPPVLPGTIYAPLQPNRNRRIRQDSQSSTSEPHHAEVGYEASVSDDLDHGDMDGSRDPKDYGRPAIHGRALPPRPSSPSGYHRSRSPGHILSPERSTARPSPYPADIGACPMPGTSPQTSRFDPSHPLPPLPMDAHTPVSATSAERERTYTNDGQPSSYPDRWRIPKEREDKERDRRRRVGDSRKDVGRYPRGPEQEAAESRQRSDPWTIVPRDVPSSDYGKDRPTTPQEGRTGRFPPSISPLNIRGGSGGSGESSRSRKKNNMVPTNWPVNWKHTMGPVPKNDHKLVVSSAPSPSLIRLGAKSMTDMRAAYSKVPASLQPGRISRVPPPPPLPVTPRPLTSSSATGGPPLPSASSTGDPLSAHTEASPSPALSTGYMRPTPTSYASSTATNGYLGSPAQDPYPRPHSALGESSSLPFTQPRHMHSPQNSETSYDPSLLQRIPPSLSIGYGTSVSYQNRDTVMRARPPHSFDDQNSDVSTCAPDVPFRGPRTPPRSPVSTSTSTFMPGTSAPLPSSMPTDPPGTAFSIRGAIDEDANSHTVRADDLTWLEGFIDENAAEGTARPRPRLQPPVQQLPTPPPTTDMATLSSSSVATLIETLNGSRRHDDESDSDSEGGTIWAKKPKKPAEASQSNLAISRSNGRPPLTPLVFPSAEPNTPGDVEFGRSPPPGFPAPPDFMPPPRTPRRTPAITHSSKKLKDRISKFDNNFDMTWAPRPPPEVMYDRLEEYFPEHDLDKPVIDAPSGGTSPTATEAPAVPVSQRFKHKKSIRVVAAEHKRQMDRTSRGDDSTVAPLSRKRHTKLWGSKLEEVTTEQGKGPLSSTSDQSPGGGAKPIFRWVRGELIGKGTYGRVYLALNATTGEMIAVKQVEIPRTASDKVDTRQVSVVEALKLESETLKDLDHPHIVQYLGFEETPSFLSIFLEYVPGGSIASCLRKHGRFDEEVTKSFTGQILSGLEYLHSRNILHRDLKADNILVETSGVCKISDFGISKRTDDINMAAAYTSMQGTVFWMAPEVVNSKGKGYNSKIDIWSLGCVVFEMWTGQRPWSGQEAMAVLLHLYNTKQAPPVPDGIKLSPLADDLRLKCFAADPDERPTAAELRKHTYLELQPGWSFNGFK